MVYLIHLDRPLKHARHYTGWSTDMTSYPKRIKHHSKGTGARFMQIVKEHGISWEVSRVWVEGDRRREKLVKKNAVRFCPQCKGSKGKRSG